MNGQRTRLIESALGVLGAMQGDGNDKHLGRRVGGKLVDGFGQHPPQPSGQGADAPIFKGVDGQLHALLVGSISDRAEKRRRSHAAGAAYAGVQIEGRGANRIATAGTEILALGEELRPANGANRGTRDTRQRRAAEPTRRRIYGTGQGIGGTSEDAGDGTPARSLGGWNVARQ